MDDTLDTELQNDTPHVGKSCVKGMGSIFCFMLR